MAKNKILIVLFFQIVFAYDVIGQSHIEQKLLLEKALSMFCDSIINNETILKDYKYRFTGFSSGKYSDIAHIAFCKNDITLLEWDNIDEVIKLHDVRKSEISGKIELKNYCFPIPSWVIYNFSKKFYYLEVNHPILYDSLYYVEIYLISKNASEIIISIQFNKNFEYIRYYLKYLDLRY